MIPHQNLELIWDSHKFWNKIWLILWYVVGHGFRSVFTVQKIVRSTEWASWIYPQMVSLVFMVVNLWGAVYGYNDGFYVAPFLWNTRCGFDARVITGKLTFISYQYSCFGKTCCLTYSAPKFDVVRVFVCRYLEEEYSSLKPLQPSSITRLTWMFS